MRPEREKRKRADGTEIDSVKNLAEYVQSFPMTGEADPPNAPKVRAQAAPEVPAPVEAPAPVAPDNSEVEALRAEAQRYRDDAARLAGENASLKTRQEAEAAARRVMAEQNQPKPQAPAQPQEDPRLRQVDNLWYMNQPEARRLLQEIQRDEMRKEMAAQRDVVKKEVFTELSTNQRKEQGNLAYAAAMTELQKRGLKPQDITLDKVNAVYSAISRKPTAEWPNPYHDRGGPLNEAVILEAWKNIIGLPEGGTAGTSAGAQNPAPTALPQPVPVAPPGSSRPAPAAAPPRSQNERLPALSAEQQRDIEHMAGAFGYDAERMKDRRRKRLANERS